MEPKKVIERLEVMRDCYNLLFEIQKLIDGRGSKNG